MQTITRETRLSDIIETVTCSRCGGTGRMPFSVANGVCFKCGGPGRVATKRGAAAREFYMRLSRTPAGVIRPGEKVYMEGINAGSFVQRGGWTTVERIVDVAAEPERAASCPILRADQLDAIEAAVERGATITWTTSQGQPAARVYEGIQVECRQRNGEGYTFGAKADTPTLVAVSKDLRVALLKTVAEYQDSLTKQGKPRKGSRWEAVAA